MKNEVIRFPYYSGNIYNSAALGYVTLNQFIKSHKNPTVRTESIIDKIKESTIAGDNKMKLHYKKMLNSFTPGVMVEIGASRKYENIKSFTRLMQIDLDKIPTVQEAIDLKEHIFHSHEDIVCAYVSPSGKGVKGLAKIKQVNSIDQFKAVHKAMTTEYEDYGYFDSATKNAILPLFLSYDKDLLSRDFWSAKEFDKENWSKTQYLNLNNFEREADYDNRQNEYHFNKVKRIITSRINAINDNGHPQVRGTALVLGSRVAAGYITGSEAEQLITNLIMSNDYLSKGLAGYIKTAKWGINEGLKQPKYF